MTAPYPITQPIPSGGYNTAQTSSAASSYSGTTDALLAQYFGTLNGGVQSARSDSPYSPIGAYDPWSSYGNTSKNAQPSAPPPLNDNTALARIQGISGLLDAQSSGQRDDNIAVEDLRNALQDNSGKYSKEDKAAIQYLLDNQNGLRGRLDHFDGSDDGNLSTKTINTLVSNPAAQGAVPLDQKMTNTQAFLAIQEYMKNKNWGEIDRHGLSDMAQNGTEEQKAAAKKLLNNEVLFKAADTGRDDNGDYDGKISRSDVASMINRAGVDKIGASAAPGTTLPAGGNSVPYTPIYSGNYYADSYYNNMYTSTLGPATAAYQSAPGAPPR